MPETLPVWHRQEWVRETCSAVGWGGRRKRESGNASPKERVGRRNTRESNPDAKRRGKEIDRKAETVGTNSYHSTPGSLYGDNLREKEWRHGVRNGFHLLTHSAAGVNIHPRPWQVHVAAHFLACNSAFIAPSCNTRSIRSVH